MKKKAEEDLLTTGECAKRRGVTTQAIDAAIRRGAIPARKVGPYRLIKASDCDAYDPAMTMKERSDRRQRKNTEEG